MEQLSLYETWYGGHYRRIVSYRFKPDEGAVGSTVHTKRSWWVRCVLEKLSGRVVRLVLPLRSLSFSWDVEGRYVWRVYTTLKNHSVPSRQQVWSAFFKLKNHSSFRPLVVCLCVVLAVSVGRSILMSRRPREGGGVCYCIESGKPVCVKPILTNDVHLRRFFLRASEEIR